MVKLNKMANDSPTRTRTRTRTTTTTKQKPNNLVSLHVKTFKKLFIIPFGPGRVLIPKMHNADRQRNEVVR
jgi:hypothetical protein